MGISLDSLDSSLHSVEIKNAAGDALLIDASGHISINDGGNSITVDAVDLDIRDLTHVSDSMKIGDGTDFLAVNADGSINVLGTFTADNVSTWKTSTVTATTSAGEIAATPFVGRGKMIIQNLGSQDVFVSDTNSVSTSDLLIPKGSSFEMNFEDDANVWVITASSTTDLRIAEFAA